MCLNPHVIVIFSNSLYASLYSVLNPNNTDPEMFPFIKKTNLEICKNESYNESQIAVQIFLPHIPLTRPKRSNVGFDFQYTNFEVKIITHFKKNMFFFTYFRHFSCICSQFTVISSIFFFNFC